MKSTLAMTLAFSAILSAGSAFADCQVSKNGSTIAASPQIELTVLPLDNQDLIEVRNDELSMSVQYRRAATDAELAQAENDNQRMELSLNGVLVEEKEVDTHAGYNGLDVTLRGYQVQCKP